MAKGTLVFEFSTSLDLENQLRAYLRLPQLVEVALGEIDESPVRPESEPEKPVEKVAEPTPPPATNVPEAPQPVAVPPEMTLETLAAADHKTLVAFVDAHPEVGVTLTDFQRGNNIWRDFVAQKVKNWLESR